MINTIAFLNNNNSEVTAYNVTDLRTGEILSSKIGVPRDLAVSVRRNGVYQMAEIDPRFRTYYIADEVICENLTARMLKHLALVWDWQLIWLVLQHIPLKNCVLLNLLKIWYHSFSHGQCIIQLSGTAR